MSRTCPTPQGQGLNEMGEDVPQEAEEPEADGGEEYHEAEMYGLDDSDDWREPFHTYGKSEFNLLTEDREEMCA
eukprot:1571892-Heterocapsa_arctica.AAC.1